MLYCIGLTAMPAEPHLRPIEVPDPRTLQWELLQRVASSSAFQKSNRAREFLLFVGKRSLIEPTAPVHEQEIGTEIFGRPANYDTSQDTLVRVQASQLRKKLQAYFEGEGAQEPWVVEMPKGSYTLVFKPRCADPAPSLSRRLLWAWATAAVLGVACLVLLIQNSSLSRRASLGLAIHPQVDRFWHQAFDNGQHSYFVAADGTLMMLENELARHVSLQEYESRSFLRLVERIADPGRRWIIQDVVNRQFTTITDADLAHRFGLISAANGISLEVILARNLALSQLTSSNVILLGSRRANPWLSLYEDKLNFQTEFTESPRSASFINRAPRKGEQTIYAGRWGQLSYCRIAFLPNLKGTGSALLISGTDVQASEAGGSFISSESWMTRLRSALGVGHGGDMPYFEALIQGPVVNSSVPRFELIALRKH